MPQVLSALLLLLLGCGAPLLCAWAVLRERARYSKGAAVLSVAEELEAELGVELHVAQAVAHDALVGRDYGFLTTAYEPRARLLNTRGGVSSFDDFKKYK